MQALVEGSDICIYIYITLQFDCIKCTTWQVPLFTEGMPNNGSSHAICLLVHHPPISVAEVLAFCLPEPVMPRVADHSESEESLKDNKKAAPDESSADEDDKEGTPEYEIEEVLDAKRGVFPDVWSTCELCFISIHK